MVKSLCDEDQSRPEKGKEEPNVHVSRNPNPNPFCAPFFGYLSPLPGSGQPERLSN